jgi:uncharacterized protein
MELDLTPVRYGRAKSRKGFADLMDLYEQNYIRLRNLAPDLKNSDHMISSVPKHQSLYLSISERCKFTTMLRLTYKFGPDNNPVFEPDLRLKMYHDARVVEVQQFHTRRFGKVEFSDELEKKWRMNRFLYKWLGFCQFQGHYFHPISHLNKR